MKFITAILILLTLVSCDPKEEPTTTSPKPSPTPTIPSPDSNLPLIEKLAKIYKNKEVAYPKLKAVTLAQWILESGWGKSKLAQEHNNFGGLKWRGDLGVPGVVKVRYKAWDGYDDYTKLPTVESYIDFYWKFIGRDVYKGFEKYKDDPKGYIEFINRAGYTPPLSYYKEVISLIPKAQELLDKF
ncbi:glucosaminidase domain-containing protein [bacterium]|nr:glucosaminidase domain-containing protein [bacterium]